MRAPKNECPSKVQMLKAPPVILKIQSVLKTCFRFPTILVLPRYRVSLQDLTIEVYAHKRKVPLLAQSDGIVVPVGPDLKMLFGISKMVRDRGADIIQREADLVAPLEPGSAFVGSGAKYRFKHIALAVIFDSQKRPSAEYISKSIISAIRMLREKGAKSVVVADMTENLLAQPSWITKESRAKTAELTARIIVEAISVSGGNAKTIKIWCTEPENVPFYVTELKRLAEQEKSGAAAVAN